MITRKIKVIIDTNWWVSFVINCYQSKLIDVLLHPYIEILSSNELNQEIYDTLNNERLQDYLNSEIKAEFLKLYPSAVKTIVVTSSVILCRDPKDNFLLSLSKDAKADFLITGDKDLLTLEKTGKTRIVNMSEFLYLIQ